MKRVTTILCVAAVTAWTMALGAQSAQNPEPRGGAETTSTQARDNTTTVSYIGCVESTGPNAFALTVSELPGTTAGATATPSRPAGTTGATPGATPSATTGTVIVGQRVQLIGSARANIGTHVGHKVEVTGTLVPQGAAPGRRTGQPAAEMRFNVNNVRMISAMCDQATSTPQTRPRSSTPDSTTQPSGREPGAAGTTGTTPAPEQPLAPTQPPPEPQPDQPQQQRQP